MPPMTSCPVAGCCCVVSGLVARTNSSRLGCRTVARDGIALASEGH
ncbi:hypothetical protein ACFY0A_37555 [Streptomyces sp. NPDC001698]